MISSVDAMTESLMTISASEILIFVPCHSIHLNILCTVHDGLTYLFAVSLSLLILKPLVSLWCS